MKNKRQIQFILAYFVGLITLGIVGYALMRFEADAAKHISSKMTVQSDVVFYPLPRMNLMLQDHDGAMARVRVDVSLEVRKKDADRLDFYQPLIVNNISEWFRQQDVDELRRHNSLSWVREDVLHSVNACGIPSPVVGIVFRNFVVM